MQLESVCDGVCDGLSGFFGGGGVGQGLLKRSDAFVSEAARDDQIEEMKGSLKVERKAVHRHALVEMKAEGSDLVGVEPDPGVLGIIEGLQ